MHHGVRPGACKALSDFLAMWAFGVSAGPMLVFGGLDSEAYGDGERKMTKGLLAFAAVGLLLLAMGFGEEGKVVTTGFTATCAGKQLTGQMNLAMAPSHQKQMVIGYVVRG